MFIYPLPLYLASRSSLFFRFGGYDPRGSRGVKDDLEQPIVAGSSDGVPPEEPGRLVTKSARRTVLRTALPAGLPRCELRSISLGAMGT